MVNCYVVICDSHLRTVVYINVLIIELQFTKRDMIT